MSRWRRATAAASPTRAQRLNESPLGAGALAGTSFPIDRAMTAKALGFARPTANSLDAVADRDFVLETLSACAIAAVHLSRFAEEIVIWSSPLVGLVRLSDAFTTGSSMMPQKRNPDAAELVRAKTGRIVGALTGLLMVMKGLPLAYQKDMQEDKEGAIDALGALALSIAAMTGMVRDMEPDAARMRQAAGEGYATATDLADWLVAHAQAAVPRGPPRDRPDRRQGGRGRRRRSTSCRSRAMQAIEPRIAKAVFGVLSVDEIGEKPRRFIGGTAPKNVRAQAKRWLKRLKRLNCGNGDKRAGKVLPTKCRRRGAICYIGWGSYPRVWGAFLAVQPSQISVSRWRCSPRPLGAGGLRTRWAARIAAGTGGRRRRRRRQRRRRRP